MYLIVSHTVISSFFNLCCHVNIITLLISWMYLCSQKDLLLLLNCSKTFNIFFCIERYSYFTLCNSTQYIACVYPFTTYSSMNSRNSKKVKKWKMKWLPSQSFLIILIKVIFLLSFKFAGPSTENDELNLHHLPLTPSNSFNSGCRGGENKITATLKLLRKLRMTSSVGVQMYSNLYKALWKY